MRGTGLTLCPYMKLEHFILAQNSSVDKDTNLLSIFNFLEDLNIQTPAPNPNIGAQAVIVLHRGDNKGPIQNQFRFMVISPSGETLVNTTVPFQFGDTHIRQRIRVNFTFVVQSSGDYQFRVESDGLGVAGSQSIKINVIPQIGNKPGGSKPILN